MVCTGFVEDLLNLFADVSSVDVAQTLGNDQIRFDFWQIASVRQQRAISVHIRGIVDESLRVLLGGRA
jgi:hypothetical protein